MSKVNSLSIVMIIAGLIGLYFVYWAGIDGVYTRRRGNDITVTDNPMMFFFFLSIPLIASLITLFGGIFLNYTGRKLNATKSSLDNLSELLSKDIKTSKEMLAKMERNEKSDKKS